MQGAMCDVAAVERALEVDAVGGRIGLLARGSDILAQRAHAEHAPAGRGHASVFIEPRTGVEQLDRVAEIDVQTVDDLTLCTLPG